MKTKFITILLLTLIIFNSCASIGTQQYTYVGDVTPLPNITGKATHLDYMGIGVSADRYADEYNRAIMDAFNNGQPGMKKNE